MRKITSAVLAVVIAVLVFAIGPPVYAAEGNYSVSTVAVSSLNLDVSGAPATITTTHDVSTITVTIAVSPDFMSAATATFAGAASEANGNFNSALSCSDTAWTGAITDTVFTRTYVIAPSFLSADGINAASTNLTATATTSADALTLTTTDAATTGFWLSLMPSVLTE